MAGESDAESTFQAGDRIFNLSPHAATRLRLRQIELARIIATIVEGEAFPYFHDGAWKDGYYSRRERLFVGVVNENVATVIPGASENYIANLKAGAP